MWLWRSIKPGMMNASPTSKVAAFEKPIGAVALPDVTAWIVPLSSMNTRPLNTASGSARSSGAIRPASIKAIEAPSG
jgi:hypothetical protein